MQCVEIWDKRGRTLSFDLKELLSAIGLSLPKYTWEILFIEVIRNENLGKVATNKLYSLLLRHNTNTSEFTEIDQQELILLSDLILQVIDTEIRGTCDEKRVLIEAIDTTYWRVCTNDKEVLEKISNGFNDVRPSRSI